MIGENDERYSTTAISSAIVHEARLQDVAA